jgi:hypothetical protein
MATAWPQPMQTTFSVVSSDMRHSNCYASTGRPLKRHFGFSRQKGKPALSTLPKPLARSRPQSHNNYA